jgi:hypothetical protein
MRLRRPQREAAIGTTLPTLDHLSHAGSISWNKSWRVVLPLSDQKKGEQPMEDVREKGFAVATNFWLNAGSRMLQQQASLLRLWADAIDKYAQNYEQGTEKLRSSVEREQHAAWLLLIGQTAGH